MGVGGEEMPETNIDFSRGLTSKGEKKQGTS